jgi:hypothetical protein
MTVLSGCTRCRVCGCSRRLRAAGQEGGGAARGWCPLPSFNQAQCEKNISECTANDLDRLAKKADCFRDIISCDDQSEQAFATAMDPVRGGTSSAMPAEAAIF